MGIYVFDRYFRVVGLSGSVPADQGTVNTGAVDLTQLTKVDVVTGKTVTFAARPDLFTVTDLPADLITITFVTPIGNQSTTFPQKIRVTKSANQAVVTATPTVLTFNQVGTQVRQTGIQLVGAGSLTVQTAGTYLVNASIAMTADAAMSLCVLELLVDGTAVANLKYPLSVGGGVTISLVGSATVDLRATQAITVRVTATSAGNILALAANTFVDIVQLHSIGT